MYNNANTTTAEVKETVPPQVVEPFSTVSGVHGGNRGRDGIGGRGRRRGRGTRNKRIERGNQSNLEKYLIAVTYWCGFRNTVYGDQICISEAIVTLENIGEKGRLYSAIVLRQLQLQHDAQVLPEGHLVFSLLFLDPFMKQIKERLNKLYI